MNNKGINKDFLKDFGKAINLDRYKSASKSKNLVCDADQIMSILLLATMEEENKGVEDEDFLGFAAKVLQKKIEVFEIPVSFKSLYGYAALDVISKGNPGKIQLIAIDLFKRLGKGKREDISVDDISKVLATWLNEDWLKEINLNKVWDEQKTPNGDNFVDSEMYWYKELGLIED